MAVYNAEQARGMSSETLCHKASFVEEKQDNDRSMSYIHVGGIFY